jgi:hypothetical protein
MSKSTLNNGDTGLVARGVINDNFTELYQRDFIHVDTFGCAGDGETDDAAALQAAFDYANTNGKNVQFGFNKTYLSSAQYLHFYGGVLEGNFSTIKMTYSTTGASVGLKAAGSIGTYYDINSDAVRGTDIINITNATFLAAIQIGDIIEIKSDKDFNDYITTYAQGETAEVTLIEGNYIYLAGKLNDTYLVSDSAQIAIINTIQARINNLTILQNKDKSTPTGSDAAFGFQIAYSKNSMLDNCSVLWAQFASFDIEHTYSMTVRNCLSQATDRSGAGYGVKLFGACTNTIIDGLVAMGCRHAITLGGGSPGVPHNTIAINCIGDSRLNVHIFDSHADAGDVIYNNCVAIGGIEKADRDDFKGIWDVSAEYTNTAPDIVERNGAFYQCAVASSTGADPETSSDWNRYNTTSGGFLCLGRKMSIINCKVINCRSGYQISTYDLRNTVIIDGLECVNVKWGVSVSSGQVINDLSIKGLTVKNNAYKSGDLCVRLQDSTITNLHINDITAINSCALYIDDIIEYLYVDTLKCSGIIYDYAALTGNIHIHIGQLQYKDIGAGPGINVDSTYIKSVVIDNAIIEELNSSLIDVSANINLVQINSLALYDCVTGGQVFNIQAGSTLTDLMLGKVSMDGNSKTLVANAGTITNYHLGQLFGPNVGTEISGNNPTIELISGTTSDPKLIKVDGTPESAVTANIGAMALRRDGGENTTLYIKESGSGNTGWIAK